MVYSMEEYGIAPELDIMHICMWPIQEIEKDRHVGVTPTFDLLRHHHFLSQFV